MDFENAEIVQMVSKLEGRVKNPEPFLRRVAKYVQKNTMQMFSKRPDLHQVRTVRWKPLAKSTIEAKRRAKKEGRAIATTRPLVFTGKLKESLASVNAIQISGKNTTYGTDLPFAQYHQRGGTKLPKRPFLFITKSERNEIGRMIKKYLDGK